MNKKELVRDLIKQVGLCPNKDGYLADEDYSVNVMTLGDKLVKYSYSSFIKIDRNTEIFYNPIDNIKLMLNTFSFYLGKLEEVRNIFFSVYYVDKDNITGKVSLVLEGDLGRFKTRYYNTLSLAYIEMIYLLNNSDQDLSSLDIIN